MYLLRLKTITRLENRLRAKQQIVRQVLNHFIQCSCNVKYYSVINNTSSDLPARAFIDNIHLHVSKEDKITVKNPDDIA